MFNFSSISIKKHLTRTIRANLLIGFDTLDLATWAMARFYHHARDSDFSLAYLLPLGKNKRYVRRCLCIAFFLATIASISHADMVMGMELSPAVCRMHPNYAPLRQCSEGRPVSVSYFSTSRQGQCSSQILLALSPLQEKVVARVIPDPYMRQQLWQNNGVCSGMTAPNYFRSITNAFNVFKLPNEILLNGRFRVNHASFLQQILNANPSLTPQSMRLFCQAGASGFPTLTQVNVCYNNAGKYSACSNIRPTNCPTTFYIDGK